MGKRYAALRPSPVCGRKCTDTVPREMDREHAGDVGQSMCTTSGGQGLRGVRTVCRTGIPGVWQDTISPLIQFTIIMPSVKLSGEEADCGEFRRINER